ncbi:MAG: hypothetical protein EOP84_12665 [Verrucomicrobiaceae bacterium]|nr:MAG: hypothetical protein EOP84_12665 [Verrucomicrobiaceae bacterium]
MSGEPLRNHIRFSPHTLKTQAARQNLLDEIESWIAVNLNRDDYFYGRYGGSSSIYVYDLNDAFAIKMRWSDFIQA